MPIIAKGPYVLDKLNRIRGEGRYEVSFSRVFNYKAIRPARLTAVGRSIDQSINEQNVTEQCPFQGPLLFLYAATIAQSVFRSPGKKIDVKTR